MIGKTISHYKILERLGGGGMGVVYKARDLKLDRFVALKFLSPYFAADADEKKRFIHEAKAASLLQHNNVCTIHEIDETEDGQMFICTDFYEGETLKKRIEQGRLNIDEVINIAIQVVQGLGEAHEHGITHRDIKSSNIMITRDGIVKIVDFGLAKFTGQSRITKTDTTVGTVAYMSPEQLRGNTVDKRTDLWAVGIVLYEMLTGKLPFNGEYEQAVMYSIMNEDPESVKGLRTNIPTELERIVNKTLVKNPHQRYQDTNEILVDLKRVFEKTATPTTVQRPASKEKTLGKLWFKKILIPIVIILIFVFGFMLLKPILFDEELVSEPKPIAVISFENQTGDSQYNYLKKAIPNLLITNLEQSKYLRVTTWERMQDLLRQMGKENVETIDKDLAFELCRIDGIDAIVLGSFTKAGNMFATDVKVLDVATKELLRGTNSKGKGENSILETQIDELSRDISRGVGISDRNIKATQRQFSDVTTTSMKAYNYFLRGREEYEKIYPDDARLFLEKAVEIDSTFAVAYLYLAWTYYELGDTKSRNEAYEKSKIYAQKATEKERLYIEAAYAGAIEQNPEKRFNILKRMAKRYPKEKRVHYLLASYYSSKKLYEKAIEKFNEALTLDPNYGDAVNDLAYTYADIGDFEMAIEHLKRYAIMSPGDANPFDSMGEIYFRMGRFDEAIANFKEALNVKPDFGAEWRVAYVYALKENYVEAMKWIDQFISVATTQGRKAEGFLWKGFYNYWIGNLDQSLNNLDRATKQAEAVGNQLFQAYADWIKAWVHFERNEFALSQKYLKYWFDLVIEIYPEYDPFYTANYYFYIGLADLKRGQIDSAKAKLSDIKLLLAKIDPFYSQKEIAEFCHDLLYAEIKFAKDSLNKAILFCKSKSFSPSPPTMYTRRLLPYNVPFVTDVLARAYQQNGWLSKSIVEYERLIAINANTKNRRLIHPKLHYRLAKLYERQGLLDKSIEQYEKFLQIWKDADKDLPDLIDAQAKLAKLRGTTAK